MTSPIGGISFPTVPTPVIGDVAAISEPTAGTSAVSGSGFADVLTSALDQVASAQSASNDLAVQAATGDLRDVHDYMIAANEAKLATEMVVTIKNKAVEAFTEIMRMPV
ncbi:flagellar hook-basal body complex protein FliE [Geodermatophilus sp. SYSU D01105]